ncbi:serine hydrolase-like protein 2 isoform 2-T2 [Dama dama]|uniref:serine hydrolase-like protein 2 isoform X2 n=1 Tax=Dama dama TaxID=30532 RepID=UPI002A361527|nr:serine hydrolase-like protein 2 isoform X2 [Dama dama]
MGLISELKLAVPWGHIAAKAWGSHQAAPVLCLHGWLNNANSFDRLIPLLPKDFHYVAMDFGGHGLSSHYSQGFPYYHQNFVSEVRRVAAGCFLSGASQDTGTARLRPTLTWLHAFSALKWNRFSLLGHSFGGTVGGMFSCIFPEMVDKLILLDALPVVLDTNEMDNLLTYKRRAIEHVLQVEASRKPAQVVSPEEMLQWFLKNNSHVGEACGKHLLQRGTTQAATGVWLNRDRRITLPEHCFDIVGKELFVQYIKNLQARILFVKATEGYYAVRRENDADRESIMFGTSSLKSVLKERFQYVEVPGNHYVHMNQPQLVADVISSFLQSKERSPVPL